MQCDFNQGSFENHVVVTNAAWAPRRALSGSQQVYAERGKNRHPQPRGLEITPVKPVFVQPFLHVLQLTFYPEAELVTCSHPAFLVSLHPPFQAPPQSLSSPPPAVFYRPPRLDTDVVSQTPAP